MKLSTSIRQGLLLPLTTFFAAWLAAGPAAKSPEPSPKVIVPGDLSAWRSPTGEWAPVRAVTLESDNPAQFVVTPGQGVLVNGRQGRTVDLMTASEFGDAEVGGIFVLGATADVAAAGPARRAGESLAHCVMD